METPTNTQLTDNLERIRTEIADAAKAAGRAPADIKLVAVSKTKPLELIRTAKAAGQEIFGENRAQEMQKKNDELPDVKWHMIGHLQRNKVKYMIDFVDMIHSIDSLRLLKEINKRAGKAGRVVNGLLQVNISEEDQKHGAGKQTLEEMLAAHQDMEHVHIQGLMGMAAYTDDDTLLHNQFTYLRNLMAEVASGAHALFTPKELSMGMSGDFKIAIEEGSTMVRVGSSIFGAR